MVCADIDCFVAHKGAIDVIVACFDVGGVAAKAPQVYVNDGSDSFAAGKPLFGKLPYTDTDVSLRLRSTLTVTLVGGCHDNTVLYCLSSSLRLI